MKKPPSELIVAPGKDLPGATRDDKAHALENYIKGGLHVMRGASLALGWAFHVMMTEEYWSNLGYASFTEFLDQQGIDLKKDVAYRLMRVYKTVCMVWQYKVEEVADIGLSKLDVIQRYAERDKPGTLVNLARELTRSDLIDHCREKYDDKHDPISDPKRVITCPHCGKVFVP